jgi:hypothetical protein
MIGHLKQDYFVEFGANHIKTPLTLRKGMRVAFFPDPFGGRWCLDEFPFDLFPGNSFVRWDAIHYGLTIPSRLVESA